MLEFQIEKRGGRGIAVGSDYTWVGDDKIIGTAHWIDADGTRTERFQVLTLRDGKIVDMQGFTSQRQAERFARRH